MSKNNFYEGKVMGVFQFLTMENGLSGSERLYERQLDELNLTEY